MLDEVTPIRFDRFMSSGKTKPSLMACQRTSGEEVEVVVKFSAKCEQGATALAMEAIVACLAKDLGLNVPEPFLVRVSEEFVGLIPHREFKEIVHTSNPIAFGSKKLPEGFTTWTQGDKLRNTSLCESAAEIFTFDMFTQNADRRPENPNCLFNGRELAVLDHELCFPPHLLDWQPPWVPDGLHRNSKDVHGHLFYRELKGKRFSLERFRGAWTNKVSDNRIEEYARAMPPEWNEASGRIQETLSKIRKQRDNVEASILAVRRVLS